MSRPAKYPPGTPVRVVIKGEPGLPLRAVVVQSWPLVVRVTDDDKVWRGAVLDKNHCRVVAERERKSA